MRERAMTVLALELESQRLASGSACASGIGLVAVPRRTPS